MSNRSNRSMRGTPEKQEKGDPVDGMQPEHEDAPPGKEMSRRDAVQLLTSLPVAAFLSWPTADQEKVRRFVDNTMRAVLNSAGVKNFGANGVPSAAEFRTARILADMII